MCLKNICTPKHHTLWYSWFVYLHPASDADCNFFLVSKVFQTLFLFCVSAVCLQVAARPALWFWTGRATGCIQPTWETQASWWSEEARWSTAQTSSSTTSTHPSSCPLLPRGLRGLSSVTGEPSPSSSLCVCCPTHMWIGLLIAYAGGVVLNS